MLMLTRSSSPLRWWSIHSLGGRGRSCGRLLAHLAVQVTEVRPPAVFRCCHELLHRKVGDGRDAELHFTAIGQRETRVIGHWNRFGVQRRRCKLEHEPAVYSMHEVDSGFGWSQRPLQGF